MFLINLYHYLSQLSQLEDNFSILRQEYRNNFQYFESYIKFQFYIFFKMKLIILLFAGFFTLGTSVHLQHEKQNHKLFGFLTGQQSESSVQSQEQSAQSTSASDQQSAQSAQDSADSSDVAENQPPAQQKVARHKSDQNPYTNAAAVVSAAQQAENAQGQNNDQGNDKPWWKFWHKKHITDHEEQGEQDSQSSTVNQNEHKWLGGLIGTATQAQAKGQKGDENGDEKQNENDNQEQNENPDENNSWLDWFNSHKKARSHNLGLRN